MIIISTLSQLINRNNIAWDLTKDAIINKGVSVPEGITVEEYSDKILSIKESNNSEFDISEIKLSQLDNDVGFITKNDLPPTSGSQIILNGGFFSLFVDEDGNLYATVPNESINPPFEYNEETGELYYIIEE